MVFDPHAFLQLTLIGGTWYELFQNVTMRYFRGILYRAVQIGVAGETTQKTGAGRFPAKSCQIFQPVLVQLIFGRRFFNVFSSSLSFHHLQSMIKWDDYPLVI